MGAFAGATLCTHIPRLLIVDETLRREYLTTIGSSFFTAFDALYAAKVEPLDFDTFLIVGTHWFTTLNYIVNGHDRLRGSTPRRSCPSCSTSTSTTTRATPILDADADALSQPQARQEGAPALDLPDLGAPQ